MKTILCLSLIVVLFVSCKKENDKDWLVADIYATDAITGGSIKNCKATLCYEQYAALGSYVQEIEIVY